MHVSVVMPVYNGEQYLEKAIKSVLTQTFSDFEFVIINDGSTDDTARILMSQDDPRIRIIENENRSGVAYSLNKGIMASRGDLIVRQDADDISLPMRFERQVAYLDTHLEVGVLGTWFQSMDETGEIGGEEKKYLDHTMIEWTSLFACPMAHPTVAMRKALIQDVGGYRAYETEDYDLWARLLDKTLFANFPESLVLHRRHPLSKTIYAPEIHKEHAFLVLNGLRKKYLGRELTLQEMTGIEKARTGKPQDSANDVIRTANIILELTFAYLNQKTFPSEDELNIKRFSADLLLNLSFSNYKIWPGEARFVLRKAISLNPKLLTRRRAWRIALGYYS
jgi:glycosyltransferase involved in cell wall biosynthesis